MLLTRLKLISGIVLLLGTVSIGVGSAIQAPDGKEGCSGRRPRPGARPHQARHEFESSARFPARRPPARADPSARFYALIEIAKAQTRSGDREGAKSRRRRPFEAAKEIDPARRAFALLIVVWTLEGAGDRDGGAEPLRLAREAIEAMTGTNEMVWPQTVYAAIQAERGDRDGARETLGRLLKFIEVIPDRTQRFGSLSSLINTLAYLGDYQEAFDMAKAQCEGDDYFQGHYLGKIAEGAASEAMYFICNPRERSRFQA